MAEASEFDEAYDGDHRNRRKQGYGGKVGNSYVEKKRRAEAIEKRKPKDEVSVKTEYDEINEEYQKKLRKQKKAEAVTKLNQERKDFFEQDFKTLALGPEPVQDKKKKDKYEEDTKNFALPQNNKKPANPANLQRAALLGFLQQNLK